MKKQKKPKLLILYRNGAMREISEKKLRPEHMKKGRYMLVPISKKTNAYWCVRPSTEWFAAKYIVDITIDTLLLDYEESIVQNYGTIPTHYETSSLVDFANYLCTLYKINGYQEVIEQGTSDICTSLQHFTPSHISVQLLDSDNTIMREYISQEEHFENGYSDDVVMRVVNNIDFQGSCLETLLMGLGVNSESLNGIPQLIEPDFNQMTWEEKKKITKCRYGGYKLFRIDYFGAYFLGSDDIWNRCLTSSGIWCKMYSFSLTDVNLMPKMVSHYLYQADHPSFLTKTALCEICENDEFDMWTLMYQFPISDAFTYLQWLTFSEDIVSYMTLMTYLIVDYFTCGPVNINDIKVLLFLCDGNSNSYSSPDSIMCSQSEVILGKLRQYLLTKLYKEDVKT
ncbi:MAG: hypothetical protein NC548_06330 [Lachnospiraceae bacterium]|nr:hypothetical protein [Lachnospiraceae bacterium]